MNASWVRLGEQATGKLGSPRRIAGEGTWSPAMRPSPWAEKKCRKKKRREAIAEFL
jgi:hypothetical protein